MSELWYWRSNERTRGPLVTEELEAIVLSKRLQDGDAVRLDGTDEWLSADEIRRMFAGSAESPAEIAARLLESAAARRVKSGSSPARRPFAIGGVVTGLLERVSAVVPWVGELSGRVVIAIGTWLGQRGRLLLLVIAGGSALVILASRIPWGESDLSRLQRLKALWRQMQSQPASSTVEPEVADWLAKTESELGKSVQEQPISGARGSERGKALARREMLFAVREIRRPTLSDESRERIDESLESATDYLLETRGPQGPTTSPKRSAGSGDSMIITAILVVDGMLAMGALAWWALRRSRR